MDNTAHAATLVELAVRIVSAYVAGNPCTADKLPDLIHSVDTSLKGLGPTKLEAAPLRPAIQINKSVTKDNIVCLEDGRRFKLLKRHLATVHGMTPQEYRAKWHLADHYPMVARAHAGRRSALTRSWELGRRERAGFQQLRSPAIQNPQSDGLGGD